MIDCVASQPNYWRHCAPIVDELRARGHEVNVWATRSGRPWGPWHGNRAMRGDLVLCASWQDARRYQRHRVVYVEHGAGQTYVPLNPGQKGDGYAGAWGLGHVVLFLGTGDHVTRRWQAAYPSARAVSVGCPALDAHYRRLGGNDGCASGDGPGPGMAGSVVAFSAHWGGPVPECQPAIYHYEHAIAALRDQAPDLTIIGHSHPRSHRRVSELWARLGVPWEPDPDVLLLSADLLVMDNSSLQAEFAALGKPLLFLNIDAYRRDVHHGMRWWDWPKGQVSCDEPDRLERCVRSALADLPSVRAARNRMVDSVYAYRDGHCAERAADAIEQVL